MRALLLVLSIVLTGCYVCTPETCADGCCTASGACIQQPIDNNACGLGGQACVDCTAQGQECVNSQCAAKCSAATCAGCCLGTTCLPTASQTSMRCGLNGATCAVCARGCSSGVCQ